jgi:hypothetical protein
MDRFFLNISFKTNFKIMQNKWISNNLIETTINLEDYLKLIKNLTVEIKETHKRQK